MLDGKISIHPNIVSRNENEVWVDVARRCYTSSSVDMSNAIHHKGHYWLPVESWNTLTFALQFDKFGNVYAKNKRRKETNSNIIKQFSLKNVVL